MIYFILRINLQQCTSKVADAGISGTVTREDQRSNIKMKSMRGENPTDIHNALREICGD